MRFTVLIILAAALAGTAAGASTLAPARIAARIVTGNGPCSENAGFGALWVANAGDSTLARIDPVTNRVTAKIKVGKGPCGVVSGADAIWVDGYGTNTVERVDPVQRKVVASIPIGPSVWDVEFGAGSVWATSELDGTVSRIDPATNKVVATIKAGSGPRQVRYGAGAIWVGNGAGKNVWRIDPATNRARAVPTGLLGPDSLAVSDRALWVAANSGSLVLRIDPRTLKVVARVKVGFHPGNPAFASDGSVFVPVTGEGTVVRIDPARNRVVSTWNVGSKPFPAAFAFGDVWVPVGGGSDRRAIPRRLTDDFSASPRSDLRKSGQTRSEVRKLPKSMVLVATRKGLFEIESDNRKDWTTRGPFCESWPLYHAIYDQDSGTIFAAAASEWLGCSGLAQLGSRGDLGAVERGPDVRRRFGPEAEQDLQPQRRPRPAVRRRGVVRRLRQH